VNKRQFFVQPGQFVRMFLLNASGPLLRNNPQLRRAINYAVDRPALVRQFGPFAGRPTDQYLLPIMPGFQNADIYPLSGPDLPKAKALAKGHTRGGTLVLYTSSGRVGRQQAEVVKQNLEKIGIRVVIRAFPGQILFQKLATRGEPFDMGWIGWSTSEPDPDLLRQLFDGTTIGKSTNINWSYFNSPRYNRLLEQASRLTGEARYRAYGRLDVELARDAAPAVAYQDDNAMSLVSARTGCVVVNPYLDLGAVCLR
jgi:ABC-type transport system substrate-binding protein